MLALGLPPSFTGVSHSGMRGRKAMLSLVTSNQTEISVLLDFTTKEVVQRQPAITDRSEMFFERIVNCQARNSP